MQVILQLNTAVVLSTAVFTDYQKFCVYVQSVCV